VSDRPTTVRARAADHAPLATTARMLIPFVLVYGVYVIMHGELGPGGGFQGGVILAAAYILYALVYGVTVAQRLLPRKATDTLAALGVLLYAGVGVVSLLKGGNFLAYDALDPHHVQHGQELGMTLVEVGVGITVAAVMVTIFNEIAEE
jgi:multicomponent Na+:H+ antiporter subunit B